MRCNSGLIGLAAWVLGVATLVGCGGSQTGDKDSPSSSPSSATSQDAGPAATVKTFLEGARTGDDEKVNSMLTSLAKTELAKRGIPVAPAKSDTARFEVGEVKYPAEGVAHVSSRWIETAGPTTGQAAAQEPTWVLRKEPEGWRIGGMAVVVFEGEPPLLLNFEQPDDMIRQMEMLQAEIAKRTAPANPPSTVAEKPDDAKQR